MSYWKRWSVWRSTMNYMVIDFVTRSNRVLSFLTVDNGNVSGLTLSSCTSSSAHLSLIYRTARQYKVGLLSVFIYQ